MLIPFTKMQALGNDFAVIRANGLELLDRESITRLADRETGIGFDQLLWLEAARAKGAAVFYRSFNRDGTEAEQCGNGARCIARLIADNPPQELVLEHVGGTSIARVEKGGNVSVEIGVPEFRPELIPFVADAEQESYELEVNGDTVEVSVVSVGNPHAVLTVDSVSEAPVENIGPLLENHARFPNRANIGFMQIVGSDRVRLRVFERGAGETRACGTGACAAVVVGRRIHKLDENITVELPGGKLTVRCEGPGARVWLTGETEMMYEGTIEI